MKDLKKLSKKKLIKKVLKQEKYLLDLQVGYSNLWVKNRELKKRIEVFDLEDDNLQDFIIGFKDRLEPFIKSLDRIDEALLKMEENNDLINSHSLFQVEDGTYDNL